ncbi:hypothetical protein [Shewanella surugensis]|uniref:Orphan protein n=1 Tax=Shewanella surugensis TaxID=212020 RepID=A0ABT0LCH7_9GAMM|nr:hypothetical protein [Shewanella surugensis]MCL1125050.1 hypothetical protein [Shewanella surugensis]
MKKCIIVSALTLASIMSTSAFAVTNEQLDAIVQQQTDYNTANSELISLKQACSLIVDEDQVQLKQYYINNNPLETCPTTDYMLFKACTTRNAENIQTRNEFDVKSSITAEDCSAL